MASLSVIRRMSLATRLVFLGEIRWFGEVKVSCFWGVSADMDDALGLKRSAEVVVMGDDASEVAVFEEAFEVVSASARAAFSKEEEAVMDGSVAYDLFEKDGTTTEECLE